MLLLGDCKCMYNANNFFMMILFQDSKLHPFKPSHTHRIVGNWDSTLNVLKCASIRPIKPGEDKFIQKLLQVSERAMRDFMAATSEY